MIRLLLVFIVLISTMNSAYADRIVFEMRAFGMKVGTMEIERSFPNDSTELYYLKADGNIDTWWMKRTEKSVYNIRYVNGTLISSDYESHKNGELVRWNRIKWNGSGYNVQSSDGEFTIRDTIDHSIVKMYFEPRTDVRKVFCEEDMSFSSVQTENGKSEMEIRCTEGNRSTYYLEAGVVRSVDVHLTVGTVKMKRIEG